MKMSMTKKVLLLTVATLILTGCTQKATTPPSSTDLVNPTITKQISPTPATNSAQPTTAQNQNTVVALTAAELAKHNNQTDCWLLISGKVYDVTSFIDTHPGGQAILAGCGQDATSLFATKGEKGEPHPTKAETMLQNYYLGKLIVQ